MQRGETNTKLQLVYTVYLQLWFTKHGGEIHSTQILWPCNAKIVV